MHKNTIIKADNFVTHITKKTHPITIMQNHAIARF